MDSNWSWLPKPGRYISNEHVEVTRGYKYPECIAKTQPKSIRVVILYKSHYFNHTVAIDTFYIKWDKERRAVFTILDEFNRYEIDCEIKDKIAEMEIVFFEPT